MRTNPRAMLACCIALSTVGLAKADFNIDVTTITSYQSPALNFYYTYGDDRRDWNTAGKLAGGQFLDVTSIPGGNTLATGVLAFCVTIDQIQSLGTYQVETQGAADHPFNPAQDGKLVTIITSAFELYQQYVASAPTDPLGHGGVYAMLAGAQVSIWQSIYGGNFDWYTTPDPSNPPGGGNDPKDPDVDYWFTYFMTHVDTGSIADLVYLLDRHTGYQNDNNKQDLVTLAGRPGGFPDPLLVEAVPLPSSVMIGLLAVCLLFVVRIKGTI